MAGLGTIQIRMTQYVRIEFEDVHTNGFYFEPPLPKSILVLNQDGMYEDLWCRAAVLCVTPSPQLGVVTVAIGWYPIDEPEDQADDGS